MTAKIVWFNQPLQPLMDLTLGKEEDLKPIPRVTLLGLPPYEKELF